MIKMKKANEYTEDMVNIIDNYFIEKLNNEIYNELYDMVDFDIIAQKIWVNVMSEILDEKENKIMDLEDEVAVLKEEIEELEDKVEG